MSSTKRKTFHLSHSILEIIPEECLCDLTGVLMMPKTSSEDIRGEDIEMMGKNFTISRVRAMVEVTV